MERGARCSEAQREYLRDLRKKGYSGVDSAAEFEERFGVSITPKAVINIWRQYGLKALHGGQRAGMRNHEFLRIYYFAFGDADIIAEQTGLKLERVVERCKGFGLDSVRKKKPRRKVNYDYDFLPDPDSIQAGATRTDGYYCK